MNETELSPIPLHYEMDNGNTVGYKISYNEHYLGWVLIKENSRWRSQIFNFLDFGESIHSKETDEELKKPNTITLKYVKPPAMMNNGEPKMLKSIENGLKAYVSNIPTIL